MRFSLTMRDQDYQGHVQTPGAQTNTKDRYRHQGYQGYLQTPRALVDTMGTMDVMNTMVNIVTMETHRHHGPLQYNLLSLITT